MPNIRRATSEPNEHFYGLLRQMLREFKTDELVYLVHKLMLKVNAMFRGNLVPRRSSGAHGHGYLSTFPDWLEHMRAGRYVFVHSPNKFKLETNFLLFFNDSNSVLPAGPVEVELHMPAVNQLWSEFRKIVKTTNDVMLPFLKLFGVEEVRGYVFTHVSVKRVLSTYRNFFPVASGSAYKFGLHGQSVIVMASECNGTGGMLVKGKGNHRCCSLCQGLKAYKIYQTISTRVDKIIEAELILKRREIDPMDVKKLQNIYRNGMSDKYFTEDGALVAKVSLDISLLTRLTDTFVNTYPLTSSYSRKLSFPVMSR